MDEHMSSLSTKDHQEGKSEAEEELEFIAILLLGILGLLIARPIGAVIQFVRNLRGKEG